MLVCPAALRGVLTAALATAIVASCGGGDRQEPGAHDAPESGRGGQEAQEVVATEEERGSFLTPCAHSHSGKDDPIVHPGHAGRSHLHEFFGATTTDASSTVESLLAEGTTCRTVADRSAYWVPALLAEGEPLRPRSVVAYYRVPVGADARRVQVPPNGLEMVAGDAAATGPQKTEVVRWRCGQGGEPAPVPEPCHPGTGPVLELRFDPCWDGENLGSPDHRSHLAPLGPDGTCPGTHPVLLPELTLEVRYPVDHPDDLTGELTVASGRWGSHGDALLAWEGAVMRREVETCLQDNLQCDVVPGGTQLSVHLPEESAR